MHLDASRLSGFSRACVPMRILGAPVSFNEQFEMFRERNFVNIEASAVGVDVTTR